MNSAMVIVLLAACMAVSVTGYGHQEEHDGPSHYKFGYAVHDPHTGDIKQQHEERDGHVVKGSYSFVEADGTKRIVEYIADPHTGFNAVVKRIGHAHHPQHYHHHEGAGANAGTGGHHHGAAESNVGVTHWGFHH